MLLYYHTTYVSTYSLEYHQVRALLRLSLGMVRKRQMLLLNEYDCANLLPASFLYRYARYLRLWLGMVPKRQMLLLNFDEWSASEAAAQAAMAQVRTSNPPLPSSSLVSVVAVE